MKNLQKYLIPCATFLAGVFLTVIFTGSSLQGSTRSATSEIDYVTNGHSQIAVKRNDVTDLDQLVSDEVVKIANEGTTGDIPDKPNKPTVEKPDVNSCIPECKSNLKSCMARARAAFDKCLADKIDPEFCMFMESKARSRCTDTYLGCLAKCDNKDPEKCLDEGGKCVGDCYDKGGSREEINACINICKGDYDECMGYGTTSAESEQTDGSEKTNEGDDT